MIRFSANKMQWKFSIFCSVHSSLCTKDWTYIFFESNTNSTKIEHHIIRIYFGTIFGMKSHEITPPNQLFFTFELKVVIFGSHLQNNITIFRTGVGTFNFPNLKVFCKSIIFKCSGELIVGNKSVDFLNTVITSTPFDFVLCSQEMWLWN